MRACGDFHTSHNKHVCGEVNPPAAFLHRHQQSFSVSVWADNVHDLLIWFYLLSLQLIAQIYRVFLEEVLPEFLEEIPFALRRNMCFQQDGAADHIARQGRKHHTAAYIDRWIGRCRSVAWLPRSPDHTPLESSHGATSKP